jgi:predicted phosphohydrolase
MSAQVNIFAVGDLHMPSRLEKHMDIFGDAWIDHVARVGAAWDERVADRDVVLVPGDISWGMRLDQVQHELDWIGERPGTKVLIRGNHDYWWQSIGKVRKALPPSCYAIQNDVFVHPTRAFAVAGTRLWDVPDLSFSEWIAGDGGLAISAAPNEDQLAADAKIFEREMGRLGRSLAALPDDVDRRVAMLHYPPTTPEFPPTRVTRLLEAHQVELCVFGHLHNLKPETSFDGVLNGVRYVLTSIDHLGFRPLRVLALEDAIG